MSLPSFLQLIRWKNILLMGYLLGLFNWILFPKLSGTVLEIELFVLFTLSILAIQAGGYIINDIFDIEIDLINKPKKVLLKNEKLVERAKGIYKTLNLIGVGTGIWFSMQIAQPGYSIVFIGAALLLFYYSKTFKSRFIIGNITVAILAMFPLIILSLVVFNSIPLEIRFFLIFVFMLSLIREIIKDCQDIKGDYKFGCKTLPIVLGTVRAVTISRILLGIVILSLVVILYFIGNNLNLKLYIFVLLLPLLWLVYKLDSTKKNWNFELFSSVLKVIFFLGMNGIYFI